MRFFALICAAGVLLGNTGYAATFGAFAQVGVCQDIQPSNSTGQSASCSLSVSGPDINVTGTASAASGNGALSAEATAWSFRDRDLVFRTTGVAQGFATYSDVLSISGVNSGMVVFRLDYAGSLLDVGGGISSTFRVANQTLFSNSTNGSGSPLDGVFQASSNFTNSSSISIFASLDATARACNIIDTQDAPFSCTASADYSGSLRLLGISVLDDLGNDVTSSVSVASQSGFGYIAGATPHDRGTTISPVPIPASVWMLFSALGGLFRLNQVRSRQSVA